jgi:DNA polymerase-1
VADTNKIYALLNYLIQGSAAELFKLKLMELDAAGLGQWMVVPVHDEVVLDVPNEHVNEAVATLRSVMNDVTTYAVPITASVSYGQRWGSKEPWPGEAD